MPTRSAIKTRKRKATRVRAKKRTAFSQRDLTLFNPRDHQIIPASGSTLSGDSVRRLFTYQSQGSNSHSSTGATHFIMYANSPFDFDFNNTLGDVQPFGYDQFLGATGMYTYYRVHNTQIELTIWLGSDSPTSTDIITPTNTEIGMEELIFTTVQGSFGGDVDTPDEARRMPGTQRKILNKAGQKAVFTWNVPNVTDVYKKTSATQVDFVRTASGQNPADLVKIFGYATDETWPIGSAVTTFYNIRAVFDIEMTGLRPVAS